MTPANQILAATIHLLFTTGLMIWGITVYVSGDNVVLVKLIELPAWAFALLIIVLYLGGFGVLFAGLAVKAEEDLIRKAVEAGQDAKEIMARFLRDARWSIEHGAEIAKDISEGIAYRATVERLATEHGVEPATIIAAYQAVVLELEQRCDLIRQVQRECEQPVKTPKYVFPSVHVIEASSVFKPLKPGDELILYNGEVVDSEATLTAAMALTDPRQTVDAVVLRQVEKEEASIVYGAMRVLHWKAVPIKLRGGTIIANLEYRTGAKAPVVEELDAVPKHDADPIRFSCPHCGKSVKVSASYAGKRGSCPKCKGRLTIPGGNSSTPSEP